MNQIIYKDVEMLPQINYQCRIQYEETTWHIKYICNNQVPQPKKWWKEKYTYLIPYK